MNALEQTDVVKVSPEDVSTNSANVLCCIIPATLKRDCLYRLKVVTQFRGSGTAFRKEPLTAYAAGEFSVPAVPSE